MTKSVKKRKANKEVIIMAIINLLFTILLMSFVFSLNVLPMKYFILITILLLIIDIGTLLLIKKKNKGLKVLGYFISILLMIISGVGIYYLSKTNQFLNDAFDNASNSYTNTYYVITLNNDDYSEIADIKDEKLGYYTSVPNIDEALEKLKETVTTKNEEYEDIQQLFKDLDKEKIAATVIESSVYNFLTEESELFDKEDYKILYEFDITIEEEVEEIVDDGNNFSVYIGGADFTGKNNDFNMVVTVNKKNHKILLTSIPRDYYVTISGKGMKDILGYVGYFGINTSRKTVEELFETNIDYYVKIDTNSLVGLVDTLGGVEFCSDTAFTTTHAMVIGSYDNSTGKKLSVAKGCKTYSGIEILTISRERKAFTDGDRQRQKNCQAIMISIFKKMVSPELITNYANILSSVSDLYTTNIPKELVTEIAKDTIDNGASWTFEQQSVTGRDSSGYVHLGTVKDYVMIPNQDSINAAIQKIKLIKAGK